LEERKLVEDALEAQGTFLEKRIPYMHQEVRIPNLTEDQVDLINETATMDSLVRGRIEVAGMEDLQPITMIGIRDRVMNIKDTLGLAWSMVRTVRGKQCPPELKRYRVLEDVSIGRRALQKLIKLGLITDEDLGWLLAVCDRYGEPGAGGELENSELMSWEFNKDYKNREMESNAIGYPPGPMRVHYTWDGKDWNDHTGYAPTVLDNEPVESTAPIGKEARFTTDGAFGQVQIVTPNDQQADIYQDLLVVKRTASWTDRRGTKHQETYMDPRDETRAALLAAIREVIDRQMVEVNGKLRWKTRAPWDGLKPKQPMTLDVPVMAVYNHLGDKDDSFGWLLDRVKNVVHTGKKLGSSVNIVTAHRMIRMYHIIRNTGTVTKSLRVKVWVNNTARWDDLIYNPVTACRPPAPPVPVGQQTRRRSN